MKSQEKLPQLRVDFFYDDRQSIEKDGLDNKREKSESSGRKCYPFNRGALYHHMGRVCNDTEIIILYGNIRKICK
jgi:hypothetical protein